VAWRAALLYPAVRHDDHREGTMAEGGPSKRGEAARKAAAARSPERRREVALKAAQTRRRNKEATAGTGGT
jgi:hypothetical protein